MALRDKKTYDVYPEPKFVITCKVKKDIGAFSFSNLAVYSAIPKS